MHHQQISGRPPQSDKTLIRPLVARLVELVLLLHYTCSLVTLASQSNSAPSATAGECNFEKYLTGCYSQANFICDPDTNRCKCLPETPVLIEQRLCIKRAKSNEFCQYNEQCDNSNGYYCTSLVEPFSATPTQQNGSYQHHQAKCRNSADLNPLNLNHPINNNNSNTSQQHYKQQYHSQHHSQQPRHTSTTGTHFTGSLLPRLLWLFLIACLIGLVVLLFLIRSQQYRIEWCLSPEVVASSQHHHHDPTQLAATRATAIDVPPPYEIAIQMKS